MASSWILKLPWVVEDSYQFEGSFILLLCNIRITMSWGRFLPVWGKFYIIHIRNTAVEYLSSTVNGMKYDLHWMKQSLKTCPPACNWFPIWVSTSLWCCPLCIMLLMPVPNQIWNVFLQLWDASLLCDASLYALEMSAQLHMFEVCAWQWRRFSSWECDWDLLLHVYIGANVQERPMLTIVIAKAFFVER